MAELDGTRATGALVGVTGVMAVATGVMTGATTGAKVYDRTVVNIMIE